MQNRALHSSMPEGMQWRSECVSAAWPSCTIAQASGNGIARSEGAHSQLVKGDESTINACVRGARERGGRYVGIFYIFLGWRPCCPG